MTKLTFKSYLTVHEEIKRQKTTKLTVKTYPTLYKAAKQVSKVAQIFVFRCPASTLAGNGKGLAKVGKS